MRLFLALLLATTLYAQATTHSCVLNWGTPADANATTTYDVWRLNSPCPTQPGSLLIGWNRVATGITALTYTDANLNVGSYCWMVTQTQGTYPASVRSFPSNLVGGTVTPQTVTVSITAKP